ncbi:MAG: TraB/GumN family protein [Crocinitomicaceae bacterium]|nr:TraB/GumN family protein [Crocinitomicaceae bacterium]
MRYLSTLIAFLICTIAYSQNDSVGASKSESALLWSITSQGSEDTSYLFGTMHMIEKEYFIFPASLDSLVANSQTLVMELPGIPNPYEMIQYVMLTEGSLFDYFNEQQEDTIINWVTENTPYNESMFRTVFDKMKPFALLQLTTLMNLHGETKSYEEDFNQIALKNKVKVVGLETVAEQMKIFDGFTNEEMTEMVMSTFRNPEETDSIFQLMQETYFKQDIDALYEMVHIEGGSFEEKENEFLIDSNKIWIPKIKEHMKKGEIFIAVGAAHLGGPDGVIQLLEKESFILTPIRL